MQVSYIENLQGLTKAPAKQDSEALESAKKEANTVEDSTDDMWWTLFGFSNDFADTGKTENTQNAGNTHYTHLKDQFFCVHMYCSMLM